ncbi:MAG: type II toxin-antitoxin system VapC family toxin [Melioribacteraceae bacterium]|nr:MAG: type II toxin-antitoxin system VapC family toxin [Melioribacteraceae bacterium]
MIMVDTDVLIWYLRGNKKAKEAIEKLDGFFISVVTYMELVQGMRNKRELTVLRSALRRWNVKILFINKDISAKAMFFVEQHYLSNSLVLADALIASTTISNGLKLLTGNSKHYKVIKNLEIEAFKP